MQCCFYHFQISKNIRKQIEIEFVTVPMIPVLFELFCSYVFIYFSIVYSLLSVRCNAKSRESRKDFPSRPVGIKYPESTAIESALRI